jgi:hypothetical protein
VAGNYITHVSLLVSTGRGKGEGLYVSTNMERVLTDSEKDEEDKRQREQQDEDDANDAQAFCQREQAYHAGKKDKRCAKRKERTAASKVVNDAATEELRPRTRAILLGMATEDILAVGMRFTSMNALKMRQSEYHECYGKILDAKSSNRSNSSGALNHNTADRYQVSCGARDREDGGPPDGEPCQYSLIAHMQLEERAVKVTTFKPHTCQCERQHHAGQATTAYSRDQLVSLVIPLMQHNQSANRKSVKTMLHPHYLKLMPKESFLDRLMDDAKIRLRGSAESRIVWLPALADELEKLGHRVKVRLCVCVRGCVRVC